ncbi:MAG: SsrA-binding protein SmpB [Phycisphaeraceae bacterium]
MARRKKSTSQPANLSPRIVNRRAHHDYHIEEKLEVGVQLLGTEVKAVRMGRASIAEGFARVDPNTRGLYLHNVEISQYPPAGPNQHEPKRTRKLLAHRREIASLAGITATKGTTLVPLAMYFKGGRIKLELGVGTGKRQHDKRQDIKQREAERDMRRAMTRKHI